MSEAEVRVPSDMIALGDNLASGGDMITEYFGLARREIASGTPLPGAVKRAAARHENHGNVAFCDSHVEALKFRTLFLDHDDGSLRRWNRDNEPHR